MDRSELERFKVYNRPTVNIDYGLRAAKGVLIGVAISVVLWIGVGLLIYEYVK